VIGSQYFPHPCLPDSPDGDTFRTQPTHDCRPFFVDLSGRQPGLDQHPVQPGFLLFRHTIRHVFALVHPVQPRACAQTDRSEIPSASKTYHCTVTVPMPRRMAPWHQTAVLPGVNYPRSVASRTADFP